MSPRAVWEENLRAAWMLAKGERRQDLSGKRAKLLDGRGLHPYSMAWGEVMACEQIDHELGTLRDTGVAWELAGMVGAGAVDPVSMRHHAARAAEADFLEDVLDHGAGVWQR